MLMQVVPLRFCHNGTKRSFLWPSKYDNICFRTGLFPGPRYGSSRLSQDPLVGSRGDTPLHTPPHSASTHLQLSPCVPPVVFCTVYICTFKLFVVKMCHMTSHSGIQLVIHYQYYNYCYDYCSYYLPLHCFKSKFVCSSVRKNHSVNGIHIEVKKAMEKDQMTGGGGRGAARGGMGGGRGGLLFCFSLMYMECTVASILVLRLRE